MFRWSSDNSTKNVGFIKVWINESIVFCLTSTTQYLHITTLPLTAVPNLRHWTLQGTQKTPAGKERKSSKVPQKSLKKMLRDFILTWTDGSESNQTASLWCSFQRRAWELETKVCGEIWHRGIPQKKNLTHSLTKGPSDGDGCQDNREGAVCNLVVHLEAKGC